MQISTIILLSLGVVAVVSLLFRSIRKWFLKALQKRHIKNMADELVFLQVKMPLKFGKEGDENEAHSMKQHIELMNQFYKNMYSIYEDSFSNRTFGQNYIAMEVIIEKEAIKFFIGTPKDHTETVEKLVVGFFPGAIIEPSIQPKFLEAGKYAYGGFFKTTKDGAYPIKTYESFEADPMDSLLSSFSRVQEDEKLGIQILISPLGEDTQENLRKEVKKIKENKKKSEGADFIRDIGKFFWSTITSGGNEEKKEEKNEEQTKFSHQQLGDLDKKPEDEVYKVIIKVLATSPVTQRPEKMVNDVTRSLSQYNYIGLNGFAFVKESDQKNFTQEYIQRVFIPPQSTQKGRTNAAEMTLNIKELSSLIHFPNSKFNKNTRIKRQNYKIVPAPDNIPNEGLLIGYNQSGGMRKEIRLKNDDRFRHFYILGQTGTGKSTIMLSMAKYDLEKGNGFCMIDPHGDLCEYVLRNYPKERIDDLIYFDLSNTEYPIAFNVFNAETEDEKDVVTNDIVEMFVGMYGEEIFGPRIQDYFRNAAFLLMDQPDGGTMPEIMRLFTDPAFLEVKLKNLKNPVIASRWNKTYRSMGDREKAEIIPFLQAKFGPFTTGPYIRNIIGQPKSAFNIYEAMQQKKVILANLSKGLVGEMNSQLIGRMLTIQLKLAAMKRAKILQKERVDYFLYIDEFQNYISKSIESVLSEARKYRLGLIVAHQYIEQLKSAGLGGNIDLSKAIFGNVGNMLVYKVGPEDAEFLERQFTPEFSKSDLVSQDKSKGAAIISIDNQPTRPFSMTPVWPYSDTYPNTLEKVAVMKQIAALKRGTKREIAEKEIFFRVGI